MMDSGASDSDFTAVTAGQQGLVKLNVQHSANVHPVSVQSGALSRRHHHTNLQLNEVHKRNQSTNSLIAVGLGNLPLQRQRHVSNEHFPTLHENRRSTVPIVSSNPLLQIMEQRRAAHSASRYTPPLHDLICSKPKNAHVNPLLQMMEGSMATAHATENPINALKNEISVRDYTGSSEVSSNALFHTSIGQQQMSFSQTSGTVRTSNSLHVDQNLADCPRLSRCARSLSELERLRQENQFIQFRQQLLQGKSRRTSLNNMTESNTLSSGLVRRSISSSSTTSLGKRSSDDDCSKGSAVSSLSSSSRKIHRSTSMDNGTLAGSCKIGSSELLYKSINKLSLNAESSIQLQHSSPTNTKRAPRRKSLISILAQQSTDDAAEAVDKTVQNTCITQFNQVKMTSIISEIPDRIKYQNTNSETKPIDIVKKALLSRGLDCNTKPSKDMEDGFFVKSTEMYGNEVVNAIRSNNIDDLRKLHADGVILQCGNQFGETLIHLACRRSHRELVSFLVEEAGVSLRVKDDYGRTPMHDLCWRANPDLELFDILLQWAPELLMLSDDRGHTPLDYSR